MIRVYDDGRYWLAVTPDANGVVLTVHPSVDGEPARSVVLHEMPVYRQEVGMAPGQTWPERWNHGRRTVALPFLGDDYEERLGDALALRVMHMLTMAYRCEWKGVTEGGVIWRDSNDGIIRDWEAANDRTLILREKRKLHGSV